MIELLTELLTIVSAYISKRPDWSQSLKDQYFAKETRFTQLKNMSVENRDEDEFENCADDLHNFLKVYGVELKK